MKKVGLVLLTFIVIGLPLLLYYFQGLDKKQRLEKTQKQPIQEIRYASNAYMQPLREEGKPSVDKVQIRGVVKSWQKNELVVLVGKDEFRITIPEQVGLHCLENEVKDKNGLPVSMKNVWLDFSRFGSVATPVARQKIIDKFPKDTDLLIISTVDENKRFTSTLIAGFGCDAL